MSQLDYILPKKKWRNGIKDSCAYNTFDSTGSDHSIATCKGQISYQKSKPPEKDPMKLTDWKTTALDNDLQKHYALTVYNRFQTLMNESTDLSRENRYNNLIKANNEIATETLPKKRINKGILSNNKNIQRVKEELTSVAAKYRIKSTRYTKQCPEEAKDNLDSTYQQEMDKYVKEKTESMEELDVERHSALAWKTMHKVTNRKSTPLTNIKGFSKIERIQSWYNHFKNLLEKENLDSPDLSSIFFNHKVSDPLPINASQFTLEELQTCLAKMSKQKTSGPDNTPTMLWKHHKLSFRTVILLQ